CCLLYCLFVFFFFQAEDGIRDKLVTGVQTCALPIFFAASMNVFAHLSNFWACSRRPGARPEIRQVGEDVHRRGENERRRPRREQIGRASCREREYSKGDETKS